MVSEVVSHLAGPLSGGSSGNRPDAAISTAARGALGSLMSTCPVAAFPHVCQVLEGLLDRKQYDALSWLDLDVYRTPEGVLQIERAQAGQYKGEVVTSKVKAKKPRQGRKKVGHVTRLLTYATSSAPHFDDGFLASPPLLSPQQDGSRAFVDDEDDDDEDEAPAPARPSAPVLTGKQAEHRARKLQEEAVIRASVREIKVRSVISPPVGEYEVWWLKRGRAGEMNVENSPGGSFPVCPTRHWAVPSPGPSYHKTSPH